MVCQDCNKKEAQVHLTQIVNNEKMSLSLCKDCAAARGFHSPLDNMPFPLAEILSDLGGSFGESKLSGAEKEVECPECGLTFEEFGRKGRLGCGQCYTTFRSSLEMIMRKIHGASLHRGTVPVLAESDTKDTKPLPVQEEERLETELTKAIDAEDFERAAEIRDKLKTIRKALSVDKV